MATLTNTIPEKTIERLSEYRRTLMNLHRQGIYKIVLKEKYDKTYSFRSG